jgi:hypothetical protein
MDGLKSGIPIITHINSARGYERFLDYEWFQIYKNDHEFIKAINIIYDLVRQNKINKEEIVNKYEDVFSFNKGVNRLKMIIDTLNPM